MCSNLETLDTEGVLVISVNEQSPQHTIQKILAVETLPDHVIEEEFIKGYEWKIDNKYYSTTVILYALTEKKVLDSKLCDKIRGTIFCFDGKVDSSFEEILNWMPLLKDISSEIQLLICDSCNDTLRKKILKWSIENEFELIELNPSDENEDGNDDSIIFSKSKGYGRVTEALQSHMWSDLVMKRDTKHQKEQKKEESDDLSNSTSPSGQNSNDADKKMSVDDEEVILEDQWLQNVFAEEDPDEESFEALFAKFASLKERASHLYGEDRKKYAEKVAIAFWKAMGGEEDEIAGLDDE